MCSFPFIPRSGSVAAAPVHWPTTNQPATSREGITLLVSTLIRPDKRGNEER